jgi:hypothetical protein
MRISTIVKIGVAAAVLNASARAGMVTWKNFQLKDTAQRAVLFGRTLPDYRLQTEVVTKAEELEIPLTIEQVSVSRDDARTVIGVAYEQRVELFPRYIYPMKFAFSVEGFNAIR